MSDTKKIIGSNVVKYRNQKNLSQKELAKKAGISANSLVGIEKGRVNTNIGILEKIAKVLQQSIERFFEP